VHCQHGRFGLWLSSHLLNARFLLGNALASLKRHDEAKAVYAEAIGLGGRELGGDWAPSGFVAALYQFEPAREVYLESLRSSPQDRNLWIRAGDTFLSARRSDEALVAYQEAIRLAPDDSRVWFSRAEALVQAGREDAIAAYEESLRLEPDFLGAKARLDVVLGELGRTGKAPD
jgi:tetratricopeptide (TPR) repeat protein